MTNTKELRRFFFEAALATYAGDAEKSTLADLLGSKSLRYGRGPFLYVDMYFVNVTISCGQTLICHDAVPTWARQYRGYCTDKEVIGVLKRP
jgi:hypothetical protein